MNMVIIITSTNIRTDTNANQRPKTTLVTQKHSYR